MTRWNACRMERLQIVQAGQGSHLDGLPLDVTDLSQQPLHRHDKLVIVDACVTHLANQLWQACNLGLLKMHPPSVR